MCRTCGQPLPYKSPHPYCNRTCWRNRTRAWEVTDVATVLRLLNSGQSVVGVADRLGISRTALLRALAQARVVRVDGKPGHPGRYAIRHWKNPRQLSLF